MQTHFRLRSHISFALFRLFFFHMTKVYLRSYDFQEHSVLHPEPQGSEERIIYLNSPHISNHLDEN